MATTSAPVTLPQTLPFTLGQGPYPIARTRISYDDVSVVSPVWSQVIDADMRSFSSSRGRDTEQSEIDAGTAVAEFDNRDRAFDPLFNAAVRPMNRIWIWYEFNGLIRDIFKGYVSSWEQAWPGGGWSDAVATANASDELSILSQSNLPETNPPRDSYSEVVQADSPDGYWSMNDDPATLVQTPEPPPAADDPPEAAQPAIKTVTGRDAAWHRRGGWFPD